MPSAHQAAVGTKRNAMIASVAAAARPAVRAIAGQCLRKPSSGSTQPSRREKSSQFARESAQTRSQRSDFIVLQFPPYTMPSIHHRPRVARPGRDSGGNQEAQRRDHRAARCRARRADDSGDPRAASPGARRISAGAEIAARRDDQHRRTGRQARAARDRAENAARRVSPYPRRRLVDRRQRSTRPGAGALRRQLRARLRVARLPACAGASLSGRSGRLRSGGAVARARRREALRHDALLDRRRIRRARISRS